jgi:hypothetical protein
MSLDRRDELGPLPEEIAATLTAWHERGPRPAVRATVTRANGVLLVVPDATTPERFTAMGAVLQAVRAAGCSLFPADTATNLDDVAHWARSLPKTDGATRIQVTGPRGTRWTEGEAVARRLVAAIAMSAMSQ